ncbi:SHOCT domain-containing protein [Streptomyces sp. NBC_00464]|uniref:SHOCT domain-containing protein n=1 Tax=Streptomyces sp. NBC_00464 TaxID=2975751 RepID=UPI002E17BD22
MSLHARKDNNALPRVPDHRGAPVVPSHAAPYPPTPAPAWGAPALAPAPASGAPPRTPAVRAPPPAPAPAPAAPTRSSQEIMDLLRQLGELRDAGVVTPADFEAKKADFLSRL